MKTKSEKHGENISKVEVTNVSRHGIWILLDGVERFLSFHDFPWFRHASVEQIMAVELPSERHLYWPLLDIDLAVESIDDPKRFPLVSKVVASDEAVVG